MAAGLAPADALLCQPGTHCKWATMAGGRVADFTTAMTGEMFSLLHDHALIGREMIAEPQDNAAFLDGVAESARGDLLGSLFGVRPASLLSLRAPADAGSFVSGLLIGVLMNLLMTPFYISLAVAIYWDLKLRKDGGDLAARVGALNPA